MNTHQVVPAAEITVDPAVFRHVVGHFASGVTVITTVVDGEFYGTTASAVSSLSMEPPMMLARLNRSSSTHDAVLKAGVFGINILAEDQSDLAMQFGRKGGASSTASRLRCRPRVCPCWTARWPPSSVGWPKPPPAARASWARSPRPAPVPASRSPISGRLRPPGAGQGARCVRGRA